MLSPLYWHNSLFKMSYRSLADLVLVAYFPATHLLSDPGLGLYGGLHRFCAAGDRNLGGLSSRWVQPQPARCLTGR